VLTTAKFGNKPRKMLLLVKLNIKLKTLEFLMMPLSKKKFLEKQS